MTALEIEYGALSSDQRRDNTLFYFREIEGESPQDFLSESLAHEEKLHQLKKRIDQLTHGKIKSYMICFEQGEPKGIDTFAQMQAVQMILWNIIEKE